ncbi:MAG: hypothetical protein ACI8P9_000770 [Parasphingorhabdus sp.]|jgi:hypothetical protein
MRTLVVGATGNTGQPLVEQLLDKGQQVRIIVRSTKKLKPIVLEHPNLEIIEASVLNLTDNELAIYVADCSSVASCLGHEPNFKGIFGEPRKLCTDATRRLCQAIEHNDAALPTKFILMNTVGVSNPDLGETRSVFERTILYVLRHTIPAHRDNETALEYLHKTVGKENNHIHWCSVRPDSLINAKESLYKIGNSPVSGLFSGLPTTRANVARFMTELITNEQIWNTWKFKMPVITNSNTGA